MKHTKLFSKVFASVLCIGLLITSCKKTYENTPDNNVDPNLATNITIKNLKDSLGTATNAQRVITADWVLSGVVVSSDKTGNFYKEIHVQQDSTAGIRIAIDAYELHADYPVGRKIYVKCKGLTIYKKNGMISLGQGYDYGIQNVNVNNYIVKATRNNPIAVRKVKINQIVQGNTLSSIRSSTLGIAYQSMLLQIDNVQLQPRDTARTFANAAIKVSWDFTDPPLVKDCNDSIIILLNSGYADFAGQMMPSKKGTITGVMTFYGSSPTSLDPQLIISEASDLNFTQARCTGPVFPPFCGTAITFSGAFSENFESYAANTKNFPSAVNYPFVGTKYWEVRSFGTPANKYIQMSSFGSGGTSTNNTVYFMLPVNFTAANTITFKANAGFYNGAALKVYTTTGYTACNAANPALFTDITSNFATLPSGPASGYGTFASAGTYSFPAGLTGNGYVIFEYKGAATGATTTMQIDDIVVN